MSRTQGSHVIVATRVRCLFFGVGWDMAFESGGGCSVDRSPRDDIEPTCDMGANPVSGFACYFDRFRSASLQVCPPLRWFVVLLTHQPLPSPSLLFDELTRSLSSIHRFSYLTGAQGVSQAYPLQSDIFRVRREAQGSGASGGAGKEGERKR